MFINKQNENNALLGENKTKSSLTFFVQKTANKETLSALLQEVDYTICREKLLAFFKISYNETVFKQWQLFCQHLDLLESDRPEKLMLLQTVLSCAENSIEPGELAQFIILATHVKSVLGVRMIYCLFSADVPTAQRRLCHYLSVCQLLLDLSDQPGIYKSVQQTLPNLEQVVENLQNLHSQRMAVKFPQRNIDEVIARFGQLSEAVQFPLSEKELSEIKIDYLEIQVQLKSLNKLSSSALKEMAKTVGMEWRNTKSHLAKCQMIAILTETIRRTYKILPYDTQILALLALINTPAKLKGRMAQIKTGEGKSMIIAMLAAFMGCQDYFVDIVTSYDYLAVRDYKKYKPFFEAVGLSASHIDNFSQQINFSGQIIYGINTAFEFAMLRDGINSSEIRFSIRNGKLQMRTYDVVIVDEADNLLLQLDSALLSIPSRDDFSWIYGPLLTFVENVLGQNSITNTMINALREHLLKELSEQYHKRIIAFDEKQLSNWLQSTQIALFEKKEKRDYSVKTSNNEHVDKILIVDFDNNGDFKEGCEWQNDVTQLVQAKHRLQITPKSLTVASVTHPTFFNLYAIILCLTGTAGELTEREEIQQTYGVDSRDIPPHFPSTGAQLTPFIAKTTQEQQEHILKSIYEMQKCGRPSLVLNRTIQSSEDFTEFLNAKTIKHQLINGNQREAQEYLEARAGEASIVTNATNKMARGADILLSPKSKQAGGLRVSMTFYPKFFRAQWQGFGRAKRQGDPGDYCMVLSIKDEYIQSLIQSLPREIAVDMLNGDTLAAREKIFIKQKIDSLLEMEIIPAQEFIGLLDELRTNETKRLSLWRHQFAQKESIFFEKQQTFFSNMKVLSQLLQANGFQETMKQLCANYTYDSNEVCEFTLQNDNWPYVTEMVRTLLDKQLHGADVDWSGVIEKFKNTYISSVQYEWALFYSQLHTDIVGENINVIRNKVEKAYAKTRVKLDQYLLDPGEKIIRHLKSILYLSHQQILIQGEQEMLGTGMII